MKILFTSHWDMKGSGYMNLSWPLCAGLTERGHEVKVLGFEYHGEEHTFPFSIIPAANLTDVIFEAEQLLNLWKPDVFVCAFDAPVQNLFLAREALSKIPYVGIFPIEADPLCLPYAMMISRMAGACVISKFGVEECKKFGIDAKYLEVCINPEIWRVPSDEEAEEARKAFGLENRFTVLTVADNQERKNLSRSMEIFAEFHKKVPDSVYLLVTREHLSVGWELRDLARVLGIGDCFLLYERGVPMEELWKIYAAADVFLITPKAEGAGLPVLESMAMGLPVIGTDCCAIHEHLTDGRGFLIPPAHSYIDPFMNGNRYFVSVEDGVKVLDEVYQMWNNDSLELDAVREKAYKYIESRSWDNSVTVLEDVLKKIKGGIGDKAQTPAVISTPESELSTGD